MTELTKFVVKKSQWLRGERPNTSYLLRRGDSKMCCLGFASLACGLKQDDIAGVRVPTGVTYHNVKYPKSFFSSSGIEESDAISAAMEINDDPSLSEEDRILKLKKIFGELGVEILFED